MTRKRVIGLAACALAVAAGSAMAFSPLACAIAVSQADKRGVELSVENASAGWFSVTLHGVSARPRGIADLSAELEELTVGVGPSLTVTSIALQRGTVTAKGDPIELRSALTAWREAQRSGATSSGGAAAPRRPLLSAEGLTLTWQGTDSRSVALRGVGVKPRGSEHLVMVDQAVLTSDNTSLEISELAVEIATTTEGPQVAGGSAETVVGSLRLPRPSTAFLPASDAAVPIAPQEPAAEALELDASEAAEQPTSGRSKSRASKKKKATKKSPAARARKKRKQQANEASQSIARQLTAFGPTVDRGWTRLQGLLQSARGALKRTIGEGAQLQVDRVHVRLAVGDEVLNVGPAPLRLRRTSDELVGTLAPPDEKAGDLALVSKIPLTGGTMELELRGGPISLATLGVHEGDFGLIGLEETALRLNTKASLSPLGVFQATADGSLNGLSLNHPAVGPDPVQGINLRWKGRLKLDVPAHHLALSDAVLQVGEPALTVNASIRQEGEITRLNGSAVIAPTPCQALLDAAPLGLIPRLEGMQFSGNFALNSALELDSSILEEAQVTWDLQTHCKVEHAPPEVDPDKFKSPFEYTAVDSEGEPLTLTTGPTTPRWTPFDEIAPGMETGLLVCEDFRFFNHPGYDNKAIQDSIRRNLLEGHFIRGASTLSMQLAKNLYLGREKTLARKIQEAALTLLLEDRLEKSEILELYLNIVEYAPDVYGIRQAAEHYFNTQPSELTLAQSLFLTSLLPSPSRERFTPDGRLKPEYAKHLKTLIQIAHKIGRITDEELESALAQEVVFGTPSPTIDIPLVAAPPAPADG